jgi:hypothetical protein
VRRWPHSAPSKGIDTAGEALVGACSCTMEPWRDAAAEPGHVLLQRVGDPRRVGVHLWLRSACQGRGPSQCCVDDFPQSDTLLPSLATTVGVRVRAKAGFGIRDDTRMLPVGLDPRQLLAPRGARGVRGFGLHAVVAAAAPLAATHLVRRVPYRLRQGSWTAADARSRVQRFRQPRTDFESMGPLHSGRW